MKDITGRDISVGDKIVYIHRVGVYCYETRLSTGIVEVVDEDGIIVKVGKSFNVVAECLVVNGYE